MKIATKIAFGGYLIIAIAAVASGLRYLFASQIMPYHLAAMGSTWENLSSGAQVMTLNFMQSAGVHLFRETNPDLLMLFEKADLACLPIKR